MIRELSLESYLMSRLTGRFTAEVQHSKQNNRHHSSRSFGGTHKRITATRVQFIWNLDIGWKVEVVTVTVFTAETHKPIFMQLLTTRI